MYEWRFQTSESLENHNDNLIKSIHQIFLEGFGLNKGWSHEGIRKRLKTSHIIGFLRKDEELCGYAFYSAPSNPLSGNYLLWEDGVCLRKEDQGKKLTEPIIKKVCSFFPSRQFKWFGGRTQNPIVMLRYSKLGKLFPFNTMYNSPNGKLLMSYLLECIDEVKEVHEKQQLDLTSGICRGVYKEGKLGDYSLDIKGANLFEIPLLQWGFQRDKGDAIIIVSELFQPF